MAFCIHCGKQLVEGARFCAFCGQLTDGNIALQGSAPGGVVSVLVKVAPAVNKQAGDIEQIIDHLRDCLGMDAEPAEDGGVRVKFRLKKDGNYLLDQVLEVIATPEGRKLKGIRLPEGVTEIGERAFFGAWELQYIELPSTLRKIGGSAFSMCPLEEIHFPPSVTHIGRSAFSVTRLSKVCLPDHLETLASSVFSSCSKLTDVVLPAGLTVIGGCAFSDCSELQKVKLPQSVKRIGSCAFQGCKALREITIPAGVNIIEQYTFDGCVNLCQVVYRPGIEIEPDAFRGCKKVDAQGKPTGYQEKVTPAKLPPDFDADKIIVHLRDNLGLDAEVGEDGGVCIMKQRETPDGNYVLTRKLRTMITHSGHKAEGITLPEGVTEIADRVFNMAWGLEYIELPSTLRKIGEEAFDNSSLVEIVIPEGVTEIGEAAFHDCMHLLKATVKCPMRVMPAEMFMACEELEEVILPANLEEIEDAAFEQCGKLRKLHLPARLKAVASGAFYECPAEAIRQVKAAFPAYKE